MTKFSDRQKATPLVVTEDNRLGNCPRLILHPADSPLMQTPPLLTEMVVFVEYDSKDGERRPAGTAFLLAMPLPGFADPFEARETYLITARHVIEKIDKESRDGRVYLRVNHREKGAHYVSIEAARWTKHPTRNVDAVVLPARFGYEAYKHGANPIENKVTPELIEKEQIGPGDDLFFPGLFVHHKGEKENIPIVRTGTIAAMPSEPIQSATQGSMRVYLIEARSIGGLSGSPVFLHLEGGRAMRALDHVGSKGGGAWNAFFLLGMVQGHYDAKDILDAAEDDIVLDSRTRSINYGIALVVPFDDIEEILNLPHLVEQRQESATKYLQKKASPPTVDD